VRVLRSKERPTMPWQAVRSAFFILLMAARQV
jgi:hypothetical protein